MKRRANMVAGVALAVCSLAPVPGLAGDAEDITAGGDADAWLALWDEGGVQMPPGMPARGLDVLTVGVPKAFAAMPASAMEILPVETVVMGDWAFSRGAYTADLTSGGNAVHMDGKFMTIFRQQNDGSWKIYRDIFNSNS